MKSFPYKILFLCIFLPPICYTITIKVLEGYYQNRETLKLNHVLIQDHEALYEGRYGIKEEIDRNIGEYLGRGFMYRLGVRTNVLVKTKDDRILYPAGVKDDLNYSTLEFTTDALNYIDMAAENYRILNEGLVISVAVRIKHNGWISNSILIFYVFLAVLTIRAFIRKSVSETEKLETEQKELIKNLSGKLKKNESRLSEVKLKEDDYLKKIVGLRKDKGNLSRDIDGLLDEMEKLEHGLEDQRDVKEETEIELLQLGEELDRMKGKLQKTRKKGKKGKAVGKRFKVLYKNVAFTEKAVEGFLSLSDEFQLKAEEIIHRLNEDASKVSVKRKVFGKGGKMNVLEIDFSYSGRVYFRRDSHSGTKIIAIGTKKSQDQDLVYLRREM